MASYASATATPGNCLITWFVQDSIFGPGPTVTRIHLLNPLPILYYNVFNFFLSGCLDGVICICNRNTGWIALLAYVQFLSLGALLLMDKARVYNSAYQIMMRGNAALHIAARKVCVQVYDLERVAIVALRGEVYDLERVAIAALRGEATAQQQQANAFQAQVATFRGFIVDQAPLKDTSCKVTKHEKTCIENQHVFILFVFDTFGFLTPEAVKLLNATGYKQRTDDLNDFKGRSSSLLKPSLQRKLLVTKPTSLGDAFSLARVTEARLEDQGATSSTSRSAVASGSQTLTKTTPRFTATRLKNLKPPLVSTPIKVENNSGATPLPIKWISSAERPNRLSKGLCFNCDNK
nr:auxilin-like protein [Tanacetum cinerariifolium]